MVTFSMLATNARTGGCGHMNGRLAFLGLLASLLLGLAAVRTAAADEAILHYGSRIAINADATLTVIETLRVRAEGRVITHGIFRAFPTHYRDRQGRNLRVTFDVLDVQRDGRPEPFRIDTVPNGNVVYIGQADVPSAAGGIHLYPGLPDRPSDRLLRRLRRNLLECHGRRLGLAPPTYRGGRSVALWRAGPAPSRLYRPGRPAWRSLRGRSRRQR